MTDATTKTCNRCGEAKLFTGFNRNKSSPDGYKSLCKVCVSDASRTYREQNPEKIRDRDRNYYAVNKDAMRASKEAWAAANPEKVRAHSRRWHERNREVSRANSRAWRNANKERAYQLTRAWSLANPDKVRGYVQKRRSEIAGLEHDGSTTQDILDTYGRYCYLCESEIAEGVTPDIDHVVPLSKGGPWTMSNLRPTHPTCNRSKCDSLITELNLPFPKPE